MDWKHNKKKFLSVLIVVVLIPAIMTLLFMRYQNDIMYQWDKILGKEPNLHIAYNVISIIPNNQPIGPLAESTKLQFLDKFVSLGLFRTKEAAIDQYNVNVNCGNQKYCMFFGVYNARKLTKSESTACQLGNLPEEVRELLHEAYFRIPETDWFTQLTKDCPNCLAIEIWGINTGEKDLSLVDFQTCFPEDYKIVHVNGSLIRTIDKQCVKIKEENIIANQEEKGEEFLGRVFINSTRQIPYYDVWSDKFSRTTGKYTSEEKSFNIKDGSILRAMMGFVNDCSFD